VNKFLKHKEILVILLISATSVLITGLTTEVYLGDEVCHYRFAKDIYAAGKRVAFDPLYPSGNPPGYFYNSEPLWHALLAVIWKLTGGISFPVAQIYHTLYYLLLILVVYLLGIQIYGKKEGAYAALLISSAPMVVSFSILFYLDVPGTAFAALSLLLLLKKRYFLAGLGISLMYFTRRNACFLVPGFLLVLLFIDKDSLIRKLKNSLFLILPTAISVPFDLRWRKIHIESSTFAIPGVTEKYTSVDTWQYIATRLTKLLWGSGEYLNSSLVNPRDVIQYFGVALLMGLIFYLLFKRGKKKDTALWIYIGVYLLIFVFFFGMNSDIRYLFPIIPLISVLAASSFSYLERFRWAKSLIVIVCLFQLLGTSFYVHQRRLIPAGIKEGFTFIKQHTPEKALFMYPGYIFIEATGRKFIWASFFQVEARMRRKKYPNLDFKKDKSSLAFWNEKEAEIKETMEINKLDYIVVDKSKIYDDTKVKHFGGYPKSFIEERLPRLPFVVKIFENQEMSVWEIRREKQVLFKQEGEIIDSGDSRNR
jgi:4-amino-4-deoxy-L-arabinose transferase-like glycosyltransferase